MGNDLIYKLRKGEIDINNQSLFFSSLIKGLLLHLDKDITIRSKSLPHLILSTGDDVMFLNAKGYDFSSEPGDVSNEHTIYNQIPRAIVTPGSIDIMTDQLSSPYSFGGCQYEGSEGVYSLAGEFRRMPVKLSCDIKYYVDSYSDLLELIQQVITKLCFIQTYNISYLGQSIICSYKIPDSIQGEHMVEMDGGTSDNKCRIMSISIEVETFIPIWSHKTLMMSDKMILNYKNNINEVH